MPDDSIPADAIARAVLTQYARLPKRGKPAAKGTKHEWTVLAGIVIETNKTLECVSLGTGLKCQSTPQLSKHGDSVHDSHAETIARRALIIYLLDQLKAAESNSPSMLTAQDSAPPKYALRADARVHMYTSQCPCGDATTSQLDARERPPRQATKRARSMHGLRGHFDSTPGIARLKPGRTDSIATTSMSCSDKLALWSAVGVQGALLARAVAPIYLSSLVVGSLYDHRAIDRAVNRRVPDLSLPAPYRVSRCAVVHTTEPFVHSLETIRMAHDAVPADASVVWCKGMDAPGAIVGGRVQGNKAAKGACARRRPAVCKLAVFERFSEVWETRGTYREAKGVCVEYRAAKEAFLAVDAFRSWTRCPPEFEAFDRNGRVVETQQE